ncbi:MAG: hypothetical protein EXQ47_10930 [Bryobacterales bacterium]|nr:hypothetical protein [Bryobacterales bacterium]
MKFAAIIEYAADPAKIAEIRPAHRVHQAKIKESGHLAIAGPFTDDSGALMIFEAESKEEVEEILRRDPFFQNGVFASWVIRPWKAVMANVDVLTRNLLVP